MGKNYSTYHNYVFQHFIFKSNQTFFLCSIPMLILLNDFNGPFKQLLFDSLKKETLLIRNS